MKIRRVCAVKFSKMCGDRFEFDFEQSRRVNAMAFCMVLLSGSGKIESATGLYNGVFAFGTINYFCITLFKVDSDRACAKNAKI